LNVKAADYMAGCNDLSRLKGRSRVEMRPLPTALSQSPYSPAKYATVEIVQHVTDDSLERYAMQVLPESDLGPLEGHLLTCPNCLDRLQFGNRIRNGYARRGVDDPGSRKVVMEIVAHGFWSAAITANLGERLRG
jgi:hypothetical protein